MGRYFGEINGSILGCVIRYLICRAMEIAEQRRLNIQVQSKDCDYKDKPDYVTDIDLALQEFYAKRIKELLPGYGIVGEENGLKLSCSDPELGDTFIVIDPIDGTSALKRKQVDGISTMIAVVQNGEIICAYIGNIIAKEMYGFRPGNPNVYRIALPERSEKLVINTEASLNSQVLSLRKNPLLLPSKLQKICLPAEKGGLCKDIEIIGGSIGVQFASLWMSRYGAILLQPGASTPWDVLPILGISEMLGFCFLRLNLETNTLKPYRPIIDKEIHYDRDYTFVIYKSRISEFKVWIEKNL